MASYMRGVQKRASIMLCRPLWGRVPPEFPRGTLWTNGPDLGDTPQELMHPLDGNGRVQRVRFDGRGHAHIACAPVETEHRAREAAAGRLLLRHTFGSGPRLSAELKQSANTNFVVHAGRGLALWEGGGPVEVDPDTLRTRGPFDLGGLARTGFPASVGAAGLDALLGLGGEAVGAHPRRCPADGTITFCMVQHNLAGTQLRFVALLPGGWTPVQSSCVQVPHFTLVHDFGVTPRHYVFFAPSMHMDYMALARGQSLAQCCQQVGPTHLYLVPRWGEGPPRVLRAQNQFVSHVANAYEHNGQLTVDAVVLSPPPHNSRTTAQLTRFQPAPDGEVRHRALWGGLTELPATAPAAQGRYYRWVYATGRPFGWVKVDVRRGGVQRCTCVPGVHMEPVFVAAPGAQTEDHGWLVGFALQGRRPVLCVADAHTMRPRCILEAPGACVFPLHGCFMEGG